MSHTRPIAATILFGIASAILYALLLLNSDLLVEWAQRTRNGEKWLFIVPLLVAFIFSFVHGTFTSHFWESIGLRAAKHDGNKNK